MESVSVSFVHPNEALIESFYAAFAAGDHETMAAAYSDEARFSDPVFPELDAAGVRAMWRMFCTSGNRLDVTWTSVQGDDRQGSARWEAIYSFPKTGRTVHNKIAASFEFSNGRVVRHLDRFDLYHWTRMALGPMGMALGWSPIVQKKIRAQAAAQLARFRANESRAQS